MTEYLRTKKSERTASKMAACLQNLPVEIRVIIFEYCLQFEGEINPFPTARQGRKPSDAVWIIPEELKARQKTPTEEPCMALLRVCSQIHSEAAHVFCGKNLWRLSAHEKEPDIAARACTFWMKYGPLVKHVTVEFSMCDVPLESLLRSDKNVRAQNEDVPPCGLKSPIHDHRLHRLLRIWYHAGMVLDTLNLKTLAIDFENFYCPSGCCRDQLWDPFCEHIGEESPWTARGRSGLAARYLPKITIFKTKVPKVTITGISEPEKKYLARSWRWRPE